MPMLTSVCPFGPSAVERVRLAAQGRSAAAAQAPVCGPGMLPAEVTDWIAAMRCCKYLEYSLHVTY
jgi:hypothetical protein